MTTTEPCAAIHPTAAAESLFHSIWYPIRYGIPPNMVSHPAWYPTQHGIPPGSVSHPAWYHTRYGESRAGNLAQNKAATLLDAVPVPVQQGVSPVPLQTWDGASPCRWRCAMWQGVAHGMNANRTVCGAHCTLQAQAILHAEMHAHPARAACCMKRTSATVNGTGRVHHVSICSFRRGICPR